VVEIEKSNELFLPIESSIQEIDGTELDHWWYVALKQQRRLP
jgi:hypothetical protein